MLFALGILSLVEPASAAELPKVAVVGIHQAELDTAKQARAIEALRSALDESGIARAVTGDDLVLAIQGRETVILADGLLGPGRRLLADGRNLYNQAQAEDAVTVLEQAVAALRLGQAAVNNTKDLWEAWVYLGTSLQALEREADAEVAFRAAMALNPSRTPNAALFPPSVVDTYTALQSALATQGVPLRIEAAPDATVYVDGESRGKGSVDLAGVYPGEHHILALSGGSQAYRRVVVRQEPVTIQLNPGPPSLGNAADTTTGRSQQTAALYRAFGDHAVGADLILLAGTAEGVLHLQLFSPISQAFSRPVTAAYTDDADDEAALQVHHLLTLIDAGGLPLANRSPIAIPLDVGANIELASLLTQPREARAPLPIAALPAPQPLVKKRNNTALYAILGTVAVAGAGTGTYLGVRAAQAEPVPPEPVRNGTILIGPF